MWAWLRMLRRVPTATSDFLGTIAVSTTSPERRTNLTWLPFWLASTKPAASRRRLTSRNGWGLSRPNFDLDHTDLRRPRRSWWLEVQLNRLLEVGKRFLLGLALAGEVEFQALGDIPLPFTPNGSRKWSLHDLIVPQARVIRAVGQAPRSLGSVVPTSGRIVGHPETDHYQGVEPPELRALAARIEWTPQARASVRRIDRQTVLNLLEALADYVFTDYGDVERWQDLGLPASAGCAACACRSTVRLIGATQRAGYLEPRSSASKRGCPFSGAKFGSMASQPGVR